MMKRENQQNSALPGRKSSPEVIVSCSRMKKSGDHSFLNFMYVLLFIVSCPCALWQHGDVRLTGALMCAAPLMYLMLFIPYRIFSGLWRGILNGLYFSGVILWGIYRMRSAAPDLVLVECLSACCMVFLAGGRSRDRNYLFFISLYLLIYGALIPRMAYLYFGAAVLVCLLIILFMQRSTFLGGTSVCRREKRIRFVPRILPCVLLLLLSAALFRYVFALMPLKDNEVPGYFQTSFMTTRDNTLTPELRKWFQFSTVRNIKQAEKQPDVSVRDLKTVQSSPVKDKEGKPMNIPEEKESVLIDDGSGSGSAPPGQDLLFYVKSPVMLYHLVRLYDDYNGKTWKESAAFKRVRILPDNMERSVTVEQQYTVVKMNSLWLCSGFEPQDVYAVVGEENKFPQQILKRSPFKFFLKETPSLPYRYVAHVQIRNKTVTDSFRRLRKEHSRGVYEEKASPEWKKKRKHSDPFWNETVSPRHYMRLPRKKISRRVRDLAKKITERCTSPYEKAVALRDYLRNNYPYTLMESQKVPAGKEACDYFLFELKQGHCEYFASALAVLARCVSLPSRVATGYSPGNYNTLNKMFEVHEYHAHAWTQIYIENMGWLTMDATPPSALDQEVLPRGLGHLRDPFGDEWKVNPPELLKSSQEVLKELFLKQLKNEKKREALIDQALIKVVKTQEKVEESVNREYKNTLKKVRRSSEQKDGRLYKIRSFFREMFRKGVAYFYSGCDFVYSMWLILLSGGSLIFVLFKTGRLLWREWYRRRCFRRMLSLEREGAKLLEDDSRKAVICYYHAFRILLHCVGYERKKNQELLEYSGELGRISLILGESSRVLFLLFYKAEYGNGALSAEDGERAQRSFEAGKKKLMDLLEDRKSGCGEGSTGP